MLRTLIIGLAVVVGLTAGPVQAQTPGPQFGPFYSGQLLVAKPSMADPRFGETVIYLAEHDRKGAFGLILNRPLLRADIADFMKGFKMAPDPDISGRFNLFSGGPVEPGAGFVLHTNDYQTDSTGMVRGQVAVTASLKTLRDIGLGKGPRRYGVYLGYAGWGPGQLEREMLMGGWDIAPYDEAIVFDDEFKTKWTRARATIGIPM